MRSGLGAGSLGIGNGLAVVAKVDSALTWRLSAGNGFIWEVRQGVGSTECSEPRVSIRSHMTGDCRWCRCPVSLGLGQPLASVTPARVILENISMVEVWVVERAYRKARRGRGQVTL